MHVSDTISMRFLCGYPDFNLDVDLKLPGQGVSALFGPSGSGKTTLLRCIAGLERAQQGQLRVNGDTWQDDETFIPTHRRPVGYVFQEASLFPHLSAMANLRYAVDRAVPAPRPWPWRKRQQPVQSTSAITLDEAVALLGIEDLLHRPPHQLSGGERQRVAIARALLIQPRLLLMDEPLASLDLARKQEILPYLENLHQRLTIPIIYVSHSVEEIMRLADYLVVLDKGRITTHGHLGETLADANFPLSAGDEMGAVLEGMVHEVDAQWRLARIIAGSQQLLIPSGTLSPGQRIRLRVLASDVSLALTRHSDSCFLNILSAEVTEVVASETGSALIKLNADGLPLLASLTSRSVHRLGLEPGKLVWAQVKSMAVLS